MVERKLNRLSGFNYSDDGYYFVTICTQDMKQWFGRVIDRRMNVNNYGIIVQRYWEEIPKHFTDISVDEYIVMPNHVHGILIIHNVGNRHACSLHIEETPRQYQRLSIIVGSFKSSVSRTLRLEHPKFTWQKSFYDHIIRNETSLNSIRNYIKYNPYKWEIDEYNPERYFN